ncbi:MAG: AMP-binding protein [Patulibacter sp.]
MATLNVSRVLRHGRDRHPDREALVGRDVRLSYAQADDAVDATAAALLGLGVGDGDRVAVLGWNSVAFLVATLAIARIGATVVPLNVRLSALELSRQLDVTDARLLLTDDENRERAVAAAETSDAAPRVVGLGRTGREQLAGQGPVNDSREPSPTPGDRLPPLEARPVERIADAPKGADDPQRILFTSGSSGHPKAVLITHGNVWFGAYTMRTELDLAGDDRVLVAPPLFHTGGMDLPGLSALFFGATLVVAERFRAPLMLELMVRERITGMSTIPPVVAAMLGEDAPADAAASLRWIVTGGCTPGLLDQMQEAFPGVRIVNGYGMTETLAGMAFNGPATIRSHAQTTGTPVRVMDVRIRREDGSPARIQEPGEVVATGLKLTAGYLGPDGDVVAHPEGWIRTGDVATVDAEGFLTYVGRQKAMIKPGGENVALEEVERVVAEHPDVLEACAIGIPDPRWGEVPKAFVLPRAEARPSAEELAAFCGGRLARYKIPKAWELVDELPRTGSGKVARSELEARERSRPATTSKTPTAESPSEAATASTTPTAESPTVRPTTGAVR